MRAVRTAGRRRARDAVQFQFDSPVNSTATSPPAAWAHHLTAAITSSSVDRIHKDFYYDTTVTDVTTPVVLDVRNGRRRVPGSGPCRHRDHARGRPAGALSSGYQIKPRPPPGQASPDPGHRCQPRLVQRMGTALRLGGPGSYNNLIVGETHSPPTGALPFSMSRRSPCSSGAGLGHVVEVGDEDMIWSWTSAIPDFRALLRKATPHWEGPGEQPSDPSPSRPGPAPPLLTGSLLALRLDRYCRSLISIFPLVR